MENPTKIDDLDWFGGTPISGNLQMDSNFNWFKIICSAIPKMSTMTIIGGITEEIFQLYCTWKTFSSSIRVVLLLLRPGLARGPPIPSIPKAVPNDHKRFPNKSHSYFKVFQCAFLKIQWNHVWSLDHLEFQWGYAQIIHFNGDFPL